MFHWCENYSSRTFIRWVQVSASVADTFISLACAFPADGASCHLMNLLKRKCWKMIKIASTFGNIGQKWYWNVLPPKKINKFWSNASGIGGHWSRIPTSWKVNAITERRKPFGRNCNEHHEFRCDFGGFAFDIFLSGNFKAPKASADYLISILRSPISFLEKNKTIWILREIFKFQWKVKTMNFDPVLEVLSNYFLNFYKNFYLIFNFLQLRWQMRSLASGCCLIFWQRGRMTPWRGEQKINLLNLADYTRQRQRDWNFYDGEQIETTNEKQWPMIHYAIQLFKKSVKIATAWWQYVCIKWQPLLTSIVINIRCGA